MPVVPLAVAVYLGGVLTILSPCILPVLPFVFASTGQPFARWTGPVLGLVVTLAAALLAGTHALGALRHVGGVDRWARRAIGGLALAAVAVLALGWDATLLSRGGLVQTAAAEEAILAHLAPGATADAARDLAGRASDPVTVTATAPARAPGVPLVPTPDLGALPDFAGGTGWINGAALGLPASGGTLTAASLRGKVVVVNVWTFACYNCLNALPYVKALAAKYHGRDVVVIGVHTPELARERVPDNVADAVRRLGVTYPVVLDPHYAIWRAFHTEYWPSVYIADGTGRLRFQHFGEGAYDDEDRVVAQLLAERAPITAEMRP